MDKDSAMVPDRLAVVELPGVFHTVEVFFP